MREKKDLVIIYTSRRIIVLFTKVEEGKLELQWGQRCPKTDLI
jgi:hypothetical protein